MSPSLFCGVEPTWNVHGLDQPGLACLLSAPGCARRHFIKSANHQKERPRRLRRQSLHPVTSVAHRLILGQSSHLSRDPSCPLAARAHTRTHITYRTYSALRILHTHTHHEGAHTPFSFNDWRLAVQATPVEYNEMTAVSLMATPENITAFFVSRHGVY